MKGVSVKELAEKYELPEEAVKEVVGEVVSDVLTLRFGFSVDATFDGRLEMTGYKERRGEMNTVNIMPEKIHRNLAREILYKLANLLTEKSVLRQYQLFKRYMRTAMEGTVAKVADEKIFVEVIESVSGERIVGECNLMDQPPRERGKYRQGEIMDFYVLNVRPAIDNGTPRVEMRLSRRSMQLPEELLRKELFANNLNAQVKAVARIAGGFSELKVSERIPKEIIKKVSDKLQERIIVRF